MGFKRNSPGCNCCDPLPCKSVTTNTSCVNDASIYTLSLLGAFTNDNCASCADWSGGLSFDLHWVGDNKWDSAASSSTNCGHTTGLPLWRLSYADPYYLLTAIGIGYQWSLHKDSWDCFGVNTLTLSEPSPVPAPCSAIPATLQVTACITEATCAVCESASAPTLSVTLGGFQSTSCNCSVLNDTFILPRFSDCWYFTDFDLECQPGDQSKLYLSAAADQSYGTFGWTVSATFQGSFIVGGQWWNPTIFQMQIVYWWGNTGLTPFDCEATRTLTYIRHSTTAVVACQDPRATTCQIN